MRTCKKCKREFPLNKNSFGHTPSGGFRWECRLCMRKTVAKHAKENPEKTAERYKKRREKVAVTSSAYDKDKLRNTLKNKQKGLCFYCQEKILGLGELDHMTPIVKGGFDVPENIVWACMKCNKEKHNKTIPEYREWLKKNSDPINF